MTIEELNDILGFTAHKMLGVRSCVPPNTPAEISEAVGKILQEAAEKIRKLAKGDGQVRNDMDAEGKGM